jgi:hypothetical protein
LPVGTEPGSGCDVNVSWNGEYDTDGNPDAPAQWKVRCGQPVAGEVAERPFCEKHLRPVADLLKSEVKITHIEAGEEFEL